MMTIAGIVFEDSWAILSDMQRSEKTLGCSTESRSHDILEERACPQLELRGHSQMLLSHTMFVQNQRRTVAHLLSSGQVTVSAGDGVEDSLGTADGDALNSVDRQRMPIASHRYQQSER
jgi:hypothetical protein